MRNFALPIVAIAATMALALPASAQTLAEDNSVKACSNQQELEQVIQSDGSITPDGCWEMSIDSLESEGERLCLLNLSTEDSGVLQQLRDLAVPSQWWIRCDELAAAVID